jgi:hypothetical protein
LLSIDGGNSPCTIPIELFILKITAWLVIGLSGHSIRRIRAKFRKLKMKLADAEHRVQIEKQTLKFAPCTTAMSALSPLG